MNTKKIEVKDIVIVGVIAALVVVGTFIHIPYGQGAFVHLGSAAIFTFSILFGGWRAGLAGAIGSGFYDLLAGFSPYTLWSFFIKGIAGLVIGSIAHSGGSKGKSVVKNVFACLAGAAWTLAGYLAAWSFVLGSFKAAILNIPSSLITSGVGMIIAIPFAATLRFTLQKAGLMK